MIHTGGQLLKVKQERKERTVSNIIRRDVNEEWAHSGYVEAGDFVFLSYCVGNVGGSVEEQVHGALDSMEMRLSEAGPLFLRGGYRPVP